jgi:hypothetical protein
MCASVYVGRRVLLSVGGFHDYVLMGIRGQVRTYLPYLDCTRYAFVRAGTVLVVVSCTGVSSTEGADVTKPRHC